MECFIVAFIYDEPSYTFSEYLLLPGLTTKDCTPDNVSLRTPLVKFKKGESASTLSASAILPTASGGIQQPTYVIFILAGSREYLRSRSEDTVLPWVRFPRFVTVGDQSLFFVL